MKGIHFETETAIFGKPENWKDEDCYGLPVQVGQRTLSDGKTFAQEIVSCWAVSPEELERIRQTGVIWLSCLGIQPPVGLFTENPLAK